MSLSKYESEVKVVKHDINEAYAKFSDLRNLALLKEKLNNPEMSEEIGKQLSQEQLDSAKKALESMECDTDHVTLQTPMGQLKLVVVEKDEPKCVKFASEGAPLQLFLWIQLLPGKTDGESLMKVTVGAEVNMFMKGMVAKPLQNAANGLADIFSRI